MDIRLIIASGCSNGTRIQRSVTFLKSLGFWRMRFFWGVISLIFKCMCFINWSYQTGFSYLTWFHNEKFFCSPLHSVSNRILTIAGACLTGNFFLFAKYFFSFVPSIGEQNEPWHGVQWKLCELLGMVRKFDIWIDQSLSPLVHRPCRCNVCNEDISSLSPLAGGGRYKFFKVDWLSPIYGL